MQAIGDHQLYAVSRQASIIRRTRQRSPPSASRRARERRPWPRGSCTRRAWSSAARYKPRPPARGTSRSPRRRRSRRRGILADSFRRLPRSSLTSATSANSSSVGERGQHRHSARCARGLRRRSERDPFDVSPYQVFSVRCLRPAHVDFDVRQSWFVFCCLLPRR